MKLHHAAIAFGLALSPSVSLAKDAPKMAAKEPHVAGAKKPDDKEAAMMAAWQKYATPGEQHAWLKKMVGSWTSTTKMWMGPGDPMVTTGTAEVKSILGDRYIQEEHNGTFMGKPFAGMGITGYDNARKNFVSTWVDNVGTGIMTCEGTLEADGKTMNSTSVSTDPMNGQPETMRVVDRFEAGKRVTDFYSKGMDGKEMKMMEITYVRK